MWLKGKKNHACGGTEEYIEKKNHKIHISILMKIMRCLSKILRKYYFFLRNKRNEEKIIDERNDFAKSCSTKSKPN